MSDIIIYGRGKTGQSLKKMLDEMGKSAVFYDDDNGFDCKKEFNDNSLVILSPGVYPYSKGVEEARKAGASLVGELEYCFPLCKSKCISVTGTNGKTTTCEMIFHILSSLDFKTRLLGNGGVPFSSQILDTKNDEVVVLESSSFQLADCEKFSPYISVLTNIAQDHLNYHGSFENYVLAKTKNFTGQSKDSYAIFNFDDDNARDISQLCNAKILYYSCFNRKADCYFENNEVVVNICGKSVKARAEFLNSFAAHNLSNALAALLACCVLKVPLEACVDSLKGYKFLPHRMQFVAQYDNVTFIDDSKATNAHATLSALKNYKDDLALIIGGSDKGEKFDGIFSYIRTQANIKYVAVVGETSNAIVACANKFGVNAEVFQDIAQAVRYCYDSIKKIGGVVLMSNACASFDAFENYAQRGNYFQRIVEELHSDKKTN